MHEMSIAVNIADISLQEAQKAGAVKINSIVLELGSLSGVMADALQFCFSSAVKSTIAETAVLEIIEQQARAVCSACGHKFDADQIVPLCPKCSELVFDVQGGRDLKIKSINVD